MLFCLEIFNRAYKQCHARFELQKCCLMAVNCVAVTNNLNAPGHTGLL